MTQEVTRQKDFVNSLSKGLAVIQAFSGDARALTLAEAAAKTGLTRAAARRILMTLEDLGFAAREGERHFVLTPRVLSLGYAYLSSMPLWHFAVPVLEALVEQLGETCSLAVIDDTELVYVLRIPVRRILSQASTIGTRLPLHCHSSGRVLLSGLTPTQLDAYFSRARFEAFTHRTVVDPARLRRLVTDAARKGYAFVNGEMEDDVSGLSVPVLDPDGAVLAALNVSYKQRGLSQASAVRSALPALKRAAERLHTGLVAGRSPARRVVRMGQVELPRMQ
jgi:IclR family pca regulon transcriptional regulator